MVDSNRGWPSGRPLKLSNFNDVFNSAAYGRKDVQLIIVTKEQAHDPVTDRLWIEALRKLRHPVEDDEIPAAPMTKSRKKAEAPKDEPMFNDGSLLDGSTKWKMPKKPFVKAANDSDGGAIDTTGMKRFPTDLKGALGMPKITSVKPFAGYDYDNS